MCGDGASLAVPRDRIHIVSPFRQGKTLIRQTKLGACPAVVPSVVDEAVTPVLVPSPYTVLKLRGEPEAAGGRDPEQPRAGAEPRGLVVRQKTGPESPLDPRIPA